jgi:hypothetical protein
LAEHRIRGTLEVVSDGAGVELGPQTRRALPAILPLNADQIVSTGRRIDLIWGDRAPRSVARSVQICASELWRILCRLRMPGSLDVSGAHRVGALPVDAHRLGCETGRSWRRARSGGAGRG